MSIEQLQNLKNRIEKLREEQIRQQTILEQAKKDLVIVQKEIKDNNIEETSLDIKIDVLKKKRDKLSEILMKKITECEGYIEKNRA